MCCDWNCKDTCKITIFFFLCRKLETLETFHNLSHFVTTPYSFLVVFAELVKHKEIFKTLMVKQLEIARQQSSFKHTVSHHSNDFLIWNLFWEFTKPIFEFQMQIKIWQSHLIFLQFQRILISVCFMLVVRIIRECVTGYSSPPVFPLKWWNKCLSFW